MWILNYLAEYNRYYNLLGIIIVIAIAWLLSSHKKSINIRLILSCLFFQAVIGCLALRTQLGQAVLRVCSRGIQYIYGFAQEGTRFVFGNLADATGPWGFVFAIKVLPVIIFFGALMGMLFYLGIIQRIVAGMSFIARPFLHTTGAETLCAVANSFLGQTEAPLLIKHYLHAMTRSEIFVVMVSGMATISGSILVVYSAMGVPAAHLLASSVMAIPAAIMIAKIIIPETHDHKDKNVHVTAAVPAANIFDAISTGTIDGLQLALNVGAMLIAFLGLLACLNVLLAALSNAIMYLFATAGFSITVPTLTLTRIFSYVFAPFGYLLGFSGNEVYQAGELLGMKIALNEFIAYSELVSMEMSDRMRIIMTYALCGFSNFSCIGIQVGGIGALVPERRVLLTQLGLRAVIAAALANLLTACVAALIL